MEGIINSLKSLFTAFGMRTAIVIISTVAIVNIIKIPILKYADRKSKEYGSEKSLYTKFITLLPMVVAFLLELIIELIVTRFQIMAIDFGALCTRGVTYGGLAVATYESVKKQLEAYVAKKTLSSSSTPMNEPSKNVLSISSEESKINFSV